MHHVCRCHSTSSFPKQEYFPFMFKYHDTRVKEGYTNELRLHSNEKDPKDKMTKKGLKE